MRGMIGLRAQSLDGEKRLNTETVGYFRKTDSGSLPAPTTPVLVEAWLWAAGGGANGSEGGGGGEAVYCRFRLNPGEVAAYNVAAATATNTNGGDTTITPPSGRPAFTAHGGKSAGNGRAGGQGGNGTTNRAGGAGGAMFAAGAAGEYGGAGGAPAGSSGGGGGAGGFSDLPGDLTGGRGGGAGPLAPAVPGGGGWAGDGPAAAGLLIAIYHKLTLS